MLPPICFATRATRVETVREEGLSGSSDEEMIGTCKQEQRGLVTLDLDFSNLLVFHPARYCGIMALRLPAKPSQEALLTVCRTLLRTIEKDSVTGSV